MNRAEFQQLAEVRIAEAGVLLAAGHWDGAYYLAGYAVECALKACIARLTRAEEFPDKDFAGKAWSHNLALLVELAGLNAQLQTAAQADPVFARYWRVVVGWKEVARYTRIPEADARHLFAAIADPVHGVLPWIKQHW